VSTLNIAAYKFVAIPEPQEWVSPLKERCQQLQLRGTVVLAGEGINLFLSGTSDAIGTFLVYLRTDVLFAGRFEELEVKESFSSRQPFRKMVVRVAKEIITMREPQIRPSNFRAPSVSPSTLKRWLDQGHDDDGREVILLDTRNSFEAAIGTFERACTMEMEKFSQFPEKIRELVIQQQHLKNKTIVPFCTGGIRCEKGALYMQSIDLPNVYQLDGGILRYFEEVGGAHWRGECFVFDERIAVDPALKQTSRQYDRNEAGT
jgi:UPF0176 protein